MYKLLVTYLFCIFFHPNAWCEIISVDQNISYVNVFESSQVFIDKNSTYSIDKITRPGIVFQAVQKSYGSFGYPSKDTIWIKFSLRNKSENTIQKLLVFSNPIIDIANLYSIKNSHEIKYASGILQKREFNNFLQFIFPISLQPYEQIDYYLELKPKTASLVFNLSLEDSKNFYKNEVFNQMVLFLFFGAMTALLVYSLLLFIISRDNVYFFYSLYLFAIILQHLSLSGVMSYLLPYDNKDIVAFEASLSVHYVNFVAIACVLFTRSFLLTQQYKVLDKVLLLAVIFILGISAVNSDENYLLNVAVYSGFILILLLEFVGIYAYYQKNKQALYYIVGWTISLSGIFVLVAYRANIFDLLSIFPYYFEATLLIEAILFSIVLANKLNNLKQEKLSLNQELILQQQSEQIRLHNLINERTKELSEALQTHKVLLNELNHRVKNNMQFITSLYALKLHGFGDPLIEEKLKDIESKIQSMARVHEMLYQQHSIDRIEAKDYFQTLVDEISKAYDITKIDIQISVEQIYLNVYESIYCGLIINELIINAVKYAFDNVGCGRINIVMQYCDGKKIVEIFDNGRGLKNEDLERSFGLLMVRSLVEEQLKGSLMQEGSKFSIAF